MYLGFYECRTSLYRCTVVTVRWYNTCTYICTHACRRARLHDMPHQIAIAIDTLLVDWPDRSGAETASLASLTTPLLCCKPRYDVQPALGLPFLRI